MEFDSVISEFYSVCSSLSSPGRLWDEFAGKFKVLTRWVRMGSTHKQAVMTW
jgi:hypothetical protein